MTKMGMTEAAARVAAVDAGNRSMRAAGRDCWAHEDYISATAAYDCVLPPGARAGAALAYLGRGVKRVYTSEEIARRTARIKAAVRWPKKVAADTETPKPETRG